jgi:ribosomal-protein-alanine N-acetyltransferase
VDALETPRLRLRPFSPADAEAHAELFADPEVLRWLGAGLDSPDSPRERSRRSLAAFVEHWSERGWGVWAVLDRASGQFLGQCGIRYWSEIDEVEILYALARRAWGQGLATEAAAAALADGFARVGLPRIVAVTRPTNHASRAVMTKIGLRFERELELLGGPAVLHACSRAEHAAFLAGRARP